MKKRNFKVLLSVCVFTVLLHTGYPYASELTGIMPKLPRPVSGFDTYNYCPSVMEEDGVTYVLYCCNASDTVKDDIHDNICVRNTKTGEDTIILRPSEGEWDSYHVCDPSITEGPFTYRNKSYRYLMAYTGCGSSHGLNGIGFAVSDDVEHGWVKIPDPVAEAKTNGGWGVGQPSLFTVNGRYVMAYTVGTETLTYEELVNVKEDLTIGEPTVISNLGTVQNTGEEDFISNADFAMYGNTLYMIMDEHSSYGYEYSSAGLPVSRNIVLYRTECNDITDTERCVWEYVERLTGLPDRGHDVRLHNACLPKYPDGTLIPGQVYFSSATDIPNDFRTSLYSYSVCEAETESTRKIIRE